jgi:3-hydroxyisobutyrate dehydrogenase-like beta-hydroxyacid dehydrogenase
VWNRTGAGAEPLVAAGAAAAASPADAARRAEAVITAVADPAALRDVVSGPDGIAAGAGSATTVIEMSTVGPDAIRWLRDAVPEEAGVLDAPVLGSLGEAEDGTLLVFVGGPEAIADRSWSLLEALGRPIRVGPLGAGASAKLVANATLVGTLTLLGETLALANRLGIRRETAFEILAATPLAAQAERRRASLEADDFPVRFRLSLARKDARLVAAAAEETGVNARVLAAAAEWFAEADVAGLGSRDYSEVLKHILGRDG